MGSVLSITRDHVWVEGLLGLFMGLRNLSIVELHSVDIWYSIFYLVYALEQWISLYLVIALFLYNFCLLIIHYIISIISKQQRWRFCPLIIRLKVILVCIWLLLQILIFCNLIDVLSILTIFQFIYKIAGLLSRKRRQLFIFPSFCCHLVVLTQSGYSPHYWHFWVSYHRCRLQRFQSMLFYRERV